MAEQVNPAATHHLPGFITPPGQTDVLMVITAVVLGVFVFGFGILYFRLHHLPEHMAHKGQKVQFEIVAVLALIAMFTHNHIFWIAALLLAFIDIPDFGGFLGRIAGSVERMAGLKPGTGADDSSDTGSATPQRAEDTASHPQSGVEPSGERKPILAVAGRKERDHV